MSQKEMEDMYLFERMVAIKIYFEGHILSEDFFDCRRSNKYSTLLTMFTSNMKEYHNHITYSNEKEIEETMIYLFPNVYQLELSRLQLLNEFIQKNISKRFTLYLLSTADALDEIEWLDTIPSIDEE